VPAPVLALVSRPDIKSVQQLKGKTIAVLIFGGVTPASTAPKLR
jgi:hypothetical protein